MWTVVVSLSLCTLMALYWYAKKALQAAKAGIALVGELIQDPDAFHALHPDWASFEAPVPFGIAPSTTWLLSPAIIKKLYALPESAAGFDTIKRRMNHGLFGLPKQCMTDLEWDQLLTSVERLFHEELAPLRMTDSLELFFRCVAAQLQDLKLTMVICGSTIALHEKLYFMVTLALVQTFFGTTFPAREVVYHLNKFDANMSTAFVPSALNFPFNVLARRQLGSEGQDAFAWVVDYIENWLAQIGTKDASELVQRAEERMQQHQWKPKDIASTLGMFMIALVANSSNTMAWQILMIIQAPELHRKIQQECEQMPASATSPVGIDLTPASLNNNAPYLMSSLQETLRLFSYVQAIRAVKKDLVLTAGHQRVFLKKGTRVATSQRLFNTDPKVFGETALAFQGGRFVRQPKLLREFNAFGGGSSLCSGRHFALAEIAGFVCLFFRNFSCDPTSISTQGAFGAPQKPQTIEIIDLTGDKLQGVWSGRKVDGKCTGSGVMRPSCDNWVSLKPSRGLIMPYRTLQRD